MNIYRSVYFGLLLFCLFSYCINFRKKEHYAWLVVLLLLLWLCTAAIAIYLIKSVGLKNNLFIFHISTPLEYVILCMLYKHSIVNAQIRKMISYSIPVFIVLSMLFSIFIQTPDFNNSYTVIIESVVMIFLSLFFLREVLLLQQVTILHQFPMFWISVGVLFYYTGNLIIEGMLNYMVNHSMELARRAYMISYIFKYLLFCLFIIGAFCDRPFTFAIKKRNR